MLSTVTNDHLIIDAKNLKVCNRSQTFDMMDPSRT